MVDEEAIFQNDREMLVVVIGYSMVAQILYQYNPTFAYSTHHNATPFTLSVSNAHNHTISHQILSFKSTISSHLLYNHSLAITTLLGYKLSLVKLFYNLLQ